MGSIREVSYETVDARFHISVFRNIGRQGFTADYFGYKPKTIPRLSPNEHAVSMPRDIVNEHRSGAQVGKLVRKCRADIERRFGKVVSIKVVDRAPHPDRLGQIKTIVHFGHADLIDVNPGNTK